MNVSEVDCYKENADMPKNWFSVPKVLGIADLSHSTHFEYYARSEYRCSGPRYYCV